MTVTATIQARMGSTRMPGKVLAEVGGKPMLAHQIARVQQSVLIDGVAVATSTNPADDAIVQVAEEAGAEVFRGSEDDVLGRVAEALTSLDVSVHVELYGDSPLPDPSILDTVIGVYFKRRSEYDCVVTGLTTTFPPGLDVNVYDAWVLQEVNMLVDDPKMREHVGANIKRMPERYRILNVEAPQHFRYPEYILEVDTAEDLELIRAIYGALYPENPHFLLGDVVAFLKQRPDLANVNASVPRRWREFRVDP